MKKSRVNANAADSGPHELETPPVTEPAETSAPAFLSDRDKILLEAEILPKFLLLQRWFAAKDRQIERTSLSLLAKIGDGRHALASVDVDFDGGSHRYFLPLAVLWDGAAPGSPHKLATLRRGSRIGALIDAASDPEFADLLMQNMRDDVTLESSDGKTVFQGTETLDAISEAGGPRLLGADQSNVSIVFGDKLILKIYRRLRAGSQPDVDMARFLTGTAGFANTPAFLGSIEHWRAGDEATTLAAAFAYVHSRGDAWRTLSEALQRELESSVDPESDFSFPLEIGELLGRRTAEMHVALATPTDDPAFAIQSTTPADVDAWVRAAVLDIEDMVANLERADLSSDAREAAEALLASREELFRKVAAVASMTPSGGQSRIHGDYHLGQVLVTASDLMIIDFEGEPRRSLEERRAKSSPLRDVAGMLRSLDYLAASTVAAHPGLAASRALRWRDATSARFLAAYAQHAAGGATYPDDPAFAHGLLQLFLIQKAAYEVGYELENRPGWVSIPLRGLLGLLGEADPSLVSP